MRPEMEQHIRELQALVNEAHKCSDARRILGIKLSQAQNILDRMQYLIDVSHFSQAAQPVIQYEIMRDRA